VDKPTRRERTVHDRATDINPCEKTVELSRWLIDRVGGEDSRVVAAIKLKKHILVVEKDQKQIDHSRKRVEKMKQRMVEDAQRRVQGESESDSDSSVTVVDKVGSGRRKRISSSSSRSSGGGRSRRTSNSVVVVAVVVGSSSK